LGVGVEPCGRIEAQLKLMDGVNPNTVWTWNAIGKRAGRLEPGRGLAGIHQGLFC